VERVALRAAGWAVTPALHAAAAEPQLFAEAGLAAAPQPWEEVVAGDAAWRFADIVHGALQDYTIADLKALVRASP